MKRTLIVAGIAALYLLFVFGRRWWNARALAHQPEAVSAVHPAYTGDELKVLHFLASSGAVRKGEASSLCYGVLNADSVRIEPHVEDLKPSLSRCVQVKPQRTTEYRLEAAGRGGKVVGANLVVEVR